MGTLRAGSIGLVKDVVVGVNATITRDSSGQITSVLEGNTTSTINRDSLGRIASVTMTGDIPGTISITRDSSGAISSVSVT